MGCELQEKLKSNLDKMTTITAQQQEVRWAVLQGHMLCSCQRSTGCSFKPWSLEAKGITWGRDPECRFQWPVR